MKKKFSAARTLTGIILYCFGAYIQFIAFIIPWTDEHYDSLPILYDYFAICYDIYLIGSIFALFALAMIVNMNYKLSIVIYSFLLILTEFFMCMFMLKAI